jgi:hypothetical protein
MSCKLLLRYPSILLLILVESAMELGFSVMFCEMVYAIMTAQWSPALFIYLVFSYSWITLTLSYVVYLAICGVAASWYFLNDTEYMPKYPVLQSLKRALTTSFGSACFAGFLLAIIQMLKSIVESNSRNGIIAILKCIAICILLIIECIMKLVTRYALIYCAIFGLSFKQGCLRWLELSTDRFATLLAGGLIINLATSYNMILFAIGTGLLGFGIGYGVFDDAEWFSRILMSVLTCVFAALMSFALFAVYSEPVITMSDTLLVCFLEAPERLLSSAAELYESLKKYYMDELGVKIAQQSGNQEDQ